MLTPGTTLDRYRILAPLGEGGMGEVYRAHDPRLAREVAIKVVRGDFAGDPERIRRFELEARAAGALNHPNVCTIHDIGTYQGAPYVVMELLEGESLRAKLRGGPLPLNDAVEYSLQVTRALAAAHAKGIVHRDLKPENLFLTSDGRVKVLDFGLAKLVRTEMPASAGDSTVSVALSESGAIVGTAGYMAPEQLRGQAVDARTDLFALGAVAHELVSGVRAFQGESFIETAAAILNAEPAPLSSLRAEVSPALEALVQRCLEKEPGKRFQSARELASGLEAIAAGRVPAGDAVPAPKQKPTPAPMPKPVPGPQRRHGRAWAAASVLALAALAGVAYWQGWPPFRGPEPPPPAKKEWILVAEFDGPPGDSTLAPATRSLLSAALDQSRTVATVPQGAIRRALQAAGKPANTRVDRALARELAFRRAVRTVLEGEVGRLGHGYSIVVRLVDVDTARVLFTERATAKNEDELIPELGRLATTLRRDLGENRASLRATRGLFLVTTPSFEAYQLFLKGMEAQGANYENRKAITLYRAAIAVDPDFASAWGALAVPYDNMGYQDSAVMCIDEAMRRADRLPATQRAGLTIYRAQLAGDSAATAAAWDRVLAENPSSSSGLMYKAGILNGQGRYEESLELFRRLAQSRPFGPGDADWGNLTDALTHLGRFDEARETVSHETGPWREPLRGWIEMSACRFAAAESLTLSNQIDPRVEAEAPGFLSTRLADIHFARGALKASSADLARVEEIKRAASAEQPLREIFAERVMRACLTEGVFPMPPDAWARDTTTYLLVMRGLRATCVGDAALARRCLGVVKTRPARQLAWLGAGPALLEARLATMEGRPGDAVRILRPFSLLRMETNDPRDGVGLVWVRWSLADAFEQTGQPDSAAVHLERNLLVPIEQTPLWPLVHRRLALLYARMGRVDDALRHLAAVEKLWDRPDPEVRRMLDVTRAAVTAAQRRRS